MARINKKSEPLFFSMTYDFLNIFLPRQAGRSSKTVSAYTTGINCFFDYVFDVAEISPMKFRFADCSYKFLLEYSQFLQVERSLAPSTVNSRLSAIRAYLFYASSVDVSIISVYMAAKKVPALTVPKPVRPIIEVDTLGAFLDAPEHTVIGERDRFILILLYDSAVRVSELVDITIGDIIYADNEYTILIHGKGKKEREIMLSERAGAHMKAYLAKYHNEDSKPSEPLIYTRWGGQIHHMSVRNVERITEKYGAQLRDAGINIPDSVYPHMIRRTRGTSLYRDGVPIENISALLGHEQIETTRKHYAFASKEQKREVINRATNTEPQNIEKEWKNNKEKIKAKFRIK